MRANWPPTTESPYDRPEMQTMKPGNFFTLRDEDHPAYDLFEALQTLGWEYDISSSRHWIHMTKGDAYVDVSLFGQGAFGCRNGYGEYGICFEDTENTWADALPHITTFMQVMVSSTRDMRERARVAGEKMRSETKS